MKIKLAKSAGFCFGVKRALSIALKTARSKSPVHMLGDIVHNEDVVKEIKALGIKKITKLRNGKGKTLLVRAHGSCNAILKSAMERGYTIVDATCPMVKEIHRIVKKAENLGRRVIIIGDTLHDEVHGITGQLKQKAIMIDDPRRIPFASISKIKRATVVVQSTQNLNKALEIVEKLKSRIIDLEFCNTICKPTKIKQEEIKQMPLVNDCVVVIGSKKSANTKRLYEISKALNPRTYWVQSQQNLRKDWFNGMRSVGVTAGASTPDATTNKIIGAIERL
ncbi:MAG: 4-hydroxy-3-methylbut-2-enyl diphosphate reductase [Candidatus Omnitrophota bacterium]|jgi:4-hydroxy-3-methylbut-2-enyl diphosphate reductase